MKKAAIKHLRALAHLKKPGYLQACRRHGRPIRHGTYLEFTDEAHAKIALEYATPQSPPCTKPRSRIPTLANAVDHTPPKNCLPCQAKADGSHPRP